MLDSFLTLDVPIACLCAPLGRFYQQLAFGGLEAKVGEVAVKGCFVLDGRGTVSAVNVMPDSAVVYADGISTPRLLNSCPKCFKFYCYHFLTLILHLRPFQIPLKVWIQN